MITLGRLGRPHGLLGWMKLQSATDPAANILNYPRLFFKRDETWLPLEIAASQLHGSAILIKLTGCDSPEAARRYTNADVAIEQNALLPLSEGEYYWHDLEGLQVTNLAGIPLGTVDHLFATGANDVLVIQGEKKYLVPYVKHRIMKIDLEKKTLVVDWHEDDAY